MHCLTLTLFPDMFPGALGHSLPGAALNKGLWACETLDIRAFAYGKHANVDDTPYGGGAGMVMRPDVVGAAIEAAYERLPNAQLIYLTPRGTPLTQSLVTQTMQCNSQQFIFLCGRFEGIDERVIQEYQPLEVSIGDYVLFGGELAAQVMMEAMLRHVPGVLGNQDTHDEESFSIGKESACLLEYPHYTKPPVWRDRAVPDVLVSGHHGNVAKWRHERAEAITRERRNDLWNAYKAAQAGQDGDHHGESVADD